LETNISESVIPIFTKCSGLVELWVYIMHASDISDRLRDVPMTTNFGAKLTTHFH